jgi:hypothetical protein
VTAATGCAWYGETDQRDVNVGAPDLDAHYWLHPIVATPATGDTITGTYPKARYFSFTAYDFHLDVIDTIYDAQLLPDAGSANPFVAKPAAGTKRHYTLHIAYVAAPKHRAPNTLYIDPTLLGHSEPLAMLALRIYVPTDPSSPQGGVPFPEVTTSSSNGTALVTEAGCATTPPSFGALIWQAAADSNYPDGLPKTPVKGATRHPVWTRQFGNIFNNPQNAYLITLISRQFGQIFVIHARVPTFPDNRRGVPPYAHAQLRYWSICTDDPHGQFVFGCAADYAAAIRRHEVTYVVSDPGARPTNATAAHGVTWLPWGGTQSGAEIFYRNMLPSPWFRYALAKVTKPGQSAKAAMGPYYPQSAYCSTATFERGGWVACRAADAR